MDEFRKVMDDDFNTAGALAVLQGFAGDLNKAKKAQGTEIQASLAASLTECGQVLGILNHDPDAWFKSSGSMDGDSIGDDEIDALIAARNEARDSSNWQEADRIRDVLAEAGILLEDGPAGTTWKRS
jgi:cysteinyl-tRNA synthetase